MNSVNVDAFLQSIGLSEKEVLVYVTLLKMGQASAYDIALKTGIYRPHVYDRLETLMEKGLVSFILQDKKKLFQAFDPHHILNLLDERKNKLELQHQEAKKAVALLSKLSNYARDETQIEVFKGKEGVKAILNDIIATGKRHEVMSIDDRVWSEWLPFFMPRYFERIKQAGIQERVITMKSKNVFLFPGQEQTYRFLDSVKLNPVPTLIYGDKVAIILTKPSITVVKITSKELAETYRRHFAQLWKIADKKPPKQ